MIIKVQMSLFTSHDSARVLIYNEDRSFQYEGGVNKDLVETMAGRPKAYFEAAMGPEGLEIGEEVDEPDW